MSGTGFIDLRRGELPKKAEKVVRQARAAEKRPAKREGEDCFECPRFVPDCCRVAMDYHSSSSRDIKYRSRSRKLPSVIASRSNMLH